MHSSNRGWGIVALAMAACAGPMSTESESKTNESLTFAEVDAGTGPTLDPVLQPCTDPASAGLDCRVDCLLGGYQSGVYAPAPPSQACPSFVLAGKTIEGFLTALPGPASNLCIARYWAPTRASYARQLMTPAGANECIYGDVSTVDAGTRDVCIYIYSEPAVWNGWIPSYPIPTGLAVEYPAGTAFTPYCDIDGTQITNGTGCPAHSCAQ
jgi:hypothetical protein